MPVSSDLIERSGDLKRELVAFARRWRYRGALRRAMDERLGGRAARDAGEATNALDHFILQGRLSDGRTPVEHFVEARPELSTAEREMLLGWRDVVEGLFAIQGRDGDRLTLVNLVDELTYRVHSNMGPAVFAQMPIGSFLMTRLTPIGDEWLLSGYQRVWPGSDRAAIARAATQLALQQPALVFRNPKKLEQAWELQRQERRDFIAFFGADQTIVPGRELAERLRAFTRFRMHDVRDAEGLSMAERARREYGAAPEPPEPDLPADLVASETVGVIYDEVEGLNLFPDFGEVAEAFAAPEAASDPRQLEAVRDYLESPGIAPLPLRRLAERDPARASRVFQGVLRRPDFSWERDGEALLRRYKADYFGRPPLPSVAPVNETLARDQLAAPAGGARRPGRNDPCPCGSGKKYKRCCGR